ncbi:MAG: translation initiation factor IF-2 N-terminal domain-containing protein [Planctomycetes bacterium]|nr:translation initiation factor IF-2 N-terminal domain-containing protein [Planctomycetota bacterium]
MAEKKKAVTQDSKTNKSQKISEIMIVNDDPGIATRIAICENGRLEELYTERIKTATSVGNIYKGRVTNVESSIQAVFVDYGGAQSGFLHVTDLHPKYFPGGETSERVGKKVAKHARPPIQKCLKRGDEILVQVMKEGIGTKGPTLTSYLSIPGRLSVIMPYMDKVGVSRKIEDLDERKEMRKVLDSIQLPDGFGFILRTAGKGKKISEVKRDIAYLVRLWKMIENRISTIAAPCQLYNESDLVVRTIRDVLRPSIDAIIVDSENAYDRIESFLRVATPRSARKVIKYNDPSPVFHAFDLERQIEEIHNREVHLPSGGRLVIDQTEALVAIDVNSGKSRSAKNSETNAINTNMEAADEICRQLRLRDLGGLVINDLIDMGKVSNRKKVEARFEKNLERDRARASVLPISRFGLMEMTRQRIRPSVLDSHYSECRHCAGLGLVKTPEEVASDATRHAGWILRDERIHRVELACSASVGSSLLSNKRSELAKYEQATGKRIVVRISETIATDQVAYFAYDKRGADIDITTLPAPVPPTIRELLANKQSGIPKEEAKPKRGRRRRNKMPLADASTIADDSNLDAEVAKLDKPIKKVKKKQKETPAQSAIRVYELARKIGKSSKEVIDRCKEAEIAVGNHMSKLTTAIVANIETLFAGDSDEDSAKTTKKRRRRGGRRRRGRKPQQENVASESGADTTTQEDTQEKKKSHSRRQTKKKQGDRENEKPDDETPKKKKKTSRRRQKKVDAVKETEIKTPSKKKKVSRRRTKKKTVTKAVKQKPETKVETKKPARRTLYGSSRRKVSSEETATSRGDRE